MDKSMSTLQRVVGMEEQGSATMPVSVAGSEGRKVGRCSTTCGSVLCLPYLCVEKTYSPQALGRNAGRTRSSSTPVQLASKHLFFAVSVMSGTP